MNPDSLDLPELFRLASRKPPKGEPDLLEALCEHLKWEDWSAPKRLTKVQSEELALQLRRAGSNTFATLYRLGEPVPYEEVVDDVVAKVKVKPREGASLAEKERAVIEGVLGEALAALPPEEAAALWKRIAPQGVPIGQITAVGAYVGGAVGQQFLYEAAMTAAAYLARVLLGRALGAGVGVALTRVFGTFFGPVGWAVTAAWLAVDLAGPAYRKTVPGVVTVGAIRASLARTEP